MSDGMFGHPIARSLAGMYIHDLTVNGQDLSFR